MHERDQRRARQERLTRVGPKTPMGTYLRCFWHPVAVTVELDEAGVRPVRLLGENFVLARTDDDGVRLVTATRPRRECVAQAMGGLIWAYVGAQPAPLLPRYEHFVREGWEGDVGVSRLPCNWLQVAENTLDPIHIEYLHMRYTNWARKQLGLPPVQVRHHARVDYALFEYGIIKKRLWVGDREDSEEWTIGHPQLFPGTAVVVYDAHWVQYQIRVPVDDTNTVYYWYNARQRAPGAPPQTEVRVWENPWQTPDGRFMPEVLNAQDMMVMITQGPITDHTAEHLGESDRGVALYRRILLEQAERALRGEDPLGVVRDPAENTPWIELPVETHLGYSIVGAAATTSYEFPDREVVAAGAAAER